MDRRYTRRAVMVGTGGLSAASAASLAGLSARDVPPVAARVAIAERDVSDRNSVEAPVAGCHTYMAFEATLHRGGPKPLDVRLNLSASPGMASIDIRSVAGDDVMWGAIESNDPAVCEFFLEVVKRVYTESRQTPDYFPKFAAERPDGVPESMSGHWIECVACEVDDALKGRPSDCPACGGRGAVWEVWVS